MALRRLKKENVMLIYPGEKHTMENPKNQVDLSVKIKEWFDYYLKDGPLKSWMSLNFLAN
jgi:dipeptidyl aminopeptidase/acylaminoacyl peptidase